MIGELTLNGTCYTNNVYFPNIVTYEIASAIYRSNLKEYSNKDIQQQVSGLYWELETYSNKNWPMSQKRNLFFYCGLLSQNTFRHFASGPKLFVRGSLCGPMLKYHLGRSPGRKAIILSFSAYIYSVSSSLCVRIIFDYWW